VQTARIAGELAARGVVVVSGGARGIDAEAHRAALRAGGRTIAVVAAGLAHPYPPEHAPLFDAIVDAGGAVLTEQATDVVPRAELFPRRNRIVAGISVATVVVEAARRSGALVTARIAVEDLSREVGCVPGSVESASSEGCHAAIREGWARLVTGAEDVVAMLSDARQLVQGALDAHTEKRAGTTQDCTHRRSGAAAMDTTSCVNLSSSMSSRTSSKSQLSTASNAPSNTSSKSPSRAQLLRQPSIDGCSPQPRHDSQVVDPNQMELSQDAQELFEWIAQHVSARESRRGGATPGETRANAAFRAGLDELEHHLGWSIPRLAAATLSLERIGRIVRDSEGAFLLAEKYR
jgi:DNA protecting protein DprA